jgi:hypothetical protein
MPLTITCPSCRTTAKVPDELRGKKLRCKACKEIFRAEAAPEPEEEVVVLTEVEKEDSEGYAPRKEPEEDRQVRRKPKKSNPRKRREAGSGKSWGVIGAVGGGIVTFLVVAGIIFRVARLAVPALGGLGGGGDAASEAPPLSAEVSVTLTGAQVTKQSGGAWPFRVDYRFDRGAPDMSKTYTLKIKPRGKPAVSVSLPSFQMQRQGTIPGQLFVTGTPSTAGLEAYLEMEGPGPGGFRKERISNIIPVNG